jgi:hypothetical protein
VRWREQRRETTTVKTTRGRLFSRRSGWTFSFGQLREKFC